MPDVFTKSKRSEVMARIRSRGNAATEGALAKLLRRHKITGWRRHVKIVTSGKWRNNKSGTSPRPSPQRGQGEKRASTRSPVTRHMSRAVRPDFIFRQARLAVFVDGCFWHGCPRHGTKPKSNAAFWRKKISRNQARDRLVTRTLRRAGWRVLRIWEHDLPRATRRQATKHKRNEARLLRRISGRAGKF